MESGLITPLALIRTGAAKGVTSGNGTNGSNDKSEVGLPCEVETAQKGSSEQLASNREMDSDPTHLNRLFHWPQGSERSQPVGNSLGSGADAFDDDDDPAWGPRGEVA